NGRDLARTSLRSVQSVSPLKSIGFASRKLDTGLRGACMNQALQAWLRQNWAWSNDRSSWEERCGIGLLLASIAAGWTLADRLTLGQQILFGSLLLTTVAFLLRRGWLKLCGPLFIYELVCVTRRSRYALLRLYVYFVVILMSCVAVPVIAANESLLLP